MVHIYDIQKSTIKRLSLQIQFEVIISLVLIVLGKTCHACVTFYILTMLHNCDSIWNMSGKKIIGV